jgi:hypothetical protein
VFATKPVYLTRNFDIVLPANGLADSSDAQAGPQTTLASHSTTVGGPGFVERTLY